MTRTSHVDNNIGVARAKSARAAQQGEQKMERMQASNADRIVLALLIVVVVVLGAVSHMIDLPRSDVVAVGLLIFLFSTLRYNKIGWWAQFTWFGDRIECFVDEGWFAVFWFFGFWYKRRNCKDQIFHMDKTRVFTADHAEVEIRDISIVWRILNLNLVNNLEEAKGSLERLLDDVVDKNVKARVKKSELLDVITMELGTDEVETSTDLEQWGIEIVRIIVPEAPEPTDPALKAAVQLKITELHERVGQSEEIETVVAMMARLQKPASEGGGGLTHDEALDQIQITTKGLVKKEDVQRILLDPTAQALLSALVGKKG